MALGHGLKRLLINVIKTQFMLLLAVLGMFTNSHTSVKGYFHTGVGWEQRNKMKKDTELIISFFCTLSFSSKPSYPSYEILISLCYFAHQPLLSLLPPPRPLRLWLCSCLGVVCGASGQDHITVWRPQAGHLRWVFRGDKGPEEPRGQDQVLQGCLTYKKYPNLDKRDLNRCFQHHRMFV